MAVGTFTLFSKNKDDLRMQDLVSANLRMALVNGAGGTLNAATTGLSVWADISASEIAAGNGYSAGGAALTGTLADTGAGGWKLSTGNPSWTASGGSIPSWRFAVLYYNGTLWGMTNPLIGYFIGDNTPADIPATVAGSTLTLPCPAGGWFDNA